MLKSKIMALTLLVLPFLGQGKDSGLDSLGVVAKGAQLVQVSDQFIFTEGPAVNKKGDVFFTDQPNNKIWKYSTENVLSVFMEDAGRSNGLYFDHKGNLIACADEKSELWSIQPNGKVTVLLSDYEGHRLNGPNDLWIDPKGGIYFTDPYYQREYWQHTSAALEGQQVYYLAKGKEKATVVDGRLQKPNGIVGTADGKHLYVADIGDHKTYKYDINRDGSLSNRQLFAEMGSDGMTLDSQGNLYLTGHGITIFNPAGEKIGNIPVSNEWVGNVCFAGKDRKTLFITASTRVYTLKMNVKGMN